ncbi:MAG: hypothetical protein J6S92_07700 [Oscillospiraceae bacterium]|nr:hypothetical protein [Oscillospiraceae bacterium]MBQ5337915.1 hypothetical protein [Oscillospiraceae bacterium]
MKKTKTVSVVMTVLALIVILGIAVYGKILDGKGDEGALIQYTVIGLSVILPIVSGICCLIPAAARSGLAWLAAILIAIAAYAAPMIASGSFSLVSDPTVLLILLGPCAAGFLLGSLIGLIRKKAAAAA